MKNYLNREDREHHLSMLVFWDYLLKWQQEATCLTNKEKGYIKTATTYLLKASDSIIDRMDRYFASRFIRESKTLGCLVVDKRNSRLKEVDEITVNIDSLYDLASYALQECCGCQEVTYRGCQRYKLFMDLSVPPAKCCTDSCPYENEDKAIERQLGSKGVFNA